MKTAKNPGAIPPEEAEQSPAHNDFLLMRYELINPPIPSLAISNRTMTTTAAQMTRKQVTAIPVRIRHCVHCYPNRNQISQPRIKISRGPMT